MQGGRKGEKSGFFRGRYRHTAVLHRGGKHDLGMGAVKLLQMVDELVQFLGGAEQNFNEHAVVTGYAVAFHHLGALLDIRIKLRFALGGPYPG